MFFDPVNEVERHRPTDTHTHTIDGALLFSSGCGDDETSDDDDDDDEVKG